MITLPTLQNFRLISIEAKSPDNDDSTEERQVNIAAHVELALAKPSDESKNLPLLSLVRITLDAQILQNESEPIATAKATYIGKFSYPLSLSYEQADAQLQDESFQRDLVSQTYPLANVNLLQQLASMGYQVNNIAIGLPINASSATPEELKEISSK